MPAAIIALGSYRGLIVCLLCLVCAFCAAEPFFEGVDLSNVDADPELERLYSDFRAAYRALDAERLSELYAEEAFYLQPGSPIRQGRAAIRDGFDRFFAGVRGSSDSIDIEFEIIARQRSAETVLDIGHFRVSRNGAAASIGKFATLSIREHGRWRFQLDAFSSLR